ncbi:MAG: tetratricopeptide repeat protein [Verrucomicrobiales bacterium]
MIKNLNPFLFLKVSVILAIMAALVVGTLWFVRTRNVDHFALATTAYQKGDYEAASIDYLNNLREVPDHPQSLSQLGLIWAKRGAPIMALLYFAEAEKHSPLGKEERYMLAEAYVMLGRTDEGRHEAERILESNPASGVALLLLAQMANDEAALTTLNNRLAQLTGAESVETHLARAMVAFKSKQQDTVESEINRALEMDPQSAKALAALGDFEWSRGELKKAEELFKRSAEISAPRTNTQLVYAEFKLRLGDDAAAEAAAKVITEETPDYFPAAVLLARALSNQERNDEALAVLDRLLAGHTSYLLARLLQSEIWLKTGNNEAAIAQLKQLRQVYPGSARVAYQFSRACIAESDWTLAEAELKRAIALDPQYDDAVIMLVRLHLRMGNAQDAEAGLRALRARRPGLAGTDSLLAEAYRQLNRYEDAVAVFESQLAQTPPNPKAHLAIGLLRQAERRYDLARKAYSMAVKSSPENVITAVTRLAEIDMSENKVGAALDRVNEQLKINPESADLHFVLGRIYANQQAWTKAEQALLKVTELDENFSKAYELLATAYLKTGRADEAIKQLNVLLSANPKNGSALITSAYLFMSRGELDKARDAFEKYLEVNPDSAPAANNLAWLYSEKFNDPDKAYALAVKARAAEPEDGAIADTLGWIVFQQGDYQRAFSLLREAAEKLPTNAVVHYHLGMAGYLMGNTGTAKTAFEKALSLGTNFDGLDEARKRLALLVGRGAGKLTLEELAQLVEQNPNDVIAQVRLAEAYRAAGEFDKSRLACEATLKINGDLLGATVLLAELHSGPLRDWQKALEYGKRARELAPADPNVTALVGMIAYGSGDQSWALALLQDSAQALPNDASVNFTLARLRFLQGKVTDSEEMMRHVISVAPASKEAAQAQKFIDAMALLRTRGQTLLDSAENIDAILAADAGDPAALLVRAAIEHERGETSRAISTCEKALEVHASFALAQRQLAGLYLEQAEKELEFGSSPTGFGSGGLGAPEAPSTPPSDSLKSASEMATQARQAMPNDAELTYILAQINQQQQNHQYTQQLLKSVIAKKDLNGPRELFFRGMAHRFLRDRNAAHRDLAEAIKQGLGGRALKQAQQILAE